MIKKFIFIKLSESRLFVVRFHDRVISVIKTKNFPLRNISARDIFVSTTSYKVTVFWAINGAGRKVQFLKGMAI